MTCSRRSGRRTVWTILSNFIVNTVGPLIVVDRVTMPRTLFPTFRIRVVSAFVEAGVTALVQLWWGFSDADADLASHGIEFPLLPGVPNTTNIRSQEVTTAPPFPLTPIVFGTPLLLIPPRISVRGATSGPGTFTLELAYAGLELEHGQVLAAGGARPPVAVPAPSPAPRWFSPYRRRLRARRRRKLLPGR